jgi:hypothetical protein
MDRREFQVFPGMTLRELLVLDLLFDDIDNEVGLTDEQVTLRDKLKGYDEILAQHADL